MPGKYIQISKIDAAKRQLEVAIKIFFKSGDVVVIHTLACAAHELLQHLANKQSIKSIIKQDVLDKIRPEKRKEYIKIITKPQNFFKHASSDPNETLEFYYTATPFLIWDACTMYNKISGESNPLFLAFIVWFYSNNPDIITNELLKKTLHDIGGSVDPSDRNFFANLAVEYENLLTP